VRRTTSPLHRENISATSSSARLPLTRLFLRPRSDSTLAIEVMGARPALPLLAPCRRAREALLHLLDVVYGRHNSATPVRRAPERGRGLVQVDHVAAGERRAEVLWRETGDEERVQLVRVLKHQGHDAPLVRATRSPMLSA